MTLETYLFKGADTKIFKCLDYENPCLDFCAFHYATFSHNFQKNCIFFQIQRELLSWLNPAWSGAHPNESQYYVRAITFHGP